MRHTHPQKYAPLKLNSFQQNYRGEQGTNGREQTTPARCRDDLAPATLQNGSYRLTVALDVVLQGLSAKYHTKSILQIAKNQSESKSPRTTEFHR